MRFITLFATLALALAIPVPVDKSEQHDHHAAKAHIQLLKMQIAKSVVYPKVHRVNAQKLLSLYEAHLANCPNADTNRLIIDLKKGESVTDFLAELVTANHEHLHVMYNESALGEIVVEGVTSSAYNAILHNAKVALIEPDCPVTISDPIESASKTMNLITWGLDRIDQEGMGSSSSSNWDYNPPPIAGAGVTVYVLDTGVRASHNDFGGRVTKLVTCMSGTCNVQSSTTNDGHGHGTHCASTATGAVYGVSKQSSVVGVKVLSDQGSGSNSGIIAGINWAVADCPDRCVISMSLGGPGSCASYSSSGVSIAAAKAAGIPVVVAAGNSDSDAANFSPASCPDSFTVGASGVTDVRASFSNFGSKIDIFAPGVGTEAAINTNDVGSQTMSGTSMACPHVAGAFAILLALRPTMTAAQAYDYLKCQATTLKSNNPDLQGSANKMLQARFPPVPRHFPSDRSLPRPPVAASLAPPAHLASPPLCLTSYVPHALSPRRSKICVVLVGPSRRAMVLSQRHPPRHPPQHPPRRRHRHHHVITANQLLSQSVPRRGPTKSRGTLTAAQSTLGLATAITRRTSSRSPASALGRTR